MPALHCRQAPFKVSC